MASASPAKGWRSPARRLTVTAIDRFTDWFTSAAAFAQGAVVTIVWLVLVFTKVVDPSGWWLLFWFTVFSGTTQFPLAYAARRASEASDRALHEIDAQTELLEQLARNEVDLLRAVLAILEERDSDSR